MTTFPTWTPRPGDIVHLHPRNWWQLPAGRYALETWREVAWQLRCLKHGKRQAIYLPDLHEQHRAGIVTPIDPAEIERDRQALALLGRAPLRSRRSQSPLDGLALWQAANPMQTEI